MVDRKLDALERHMQGLSIARKEGNRLQEGMTCFSLGNCYQDVVDFKQAIRIRLKIAP